MSRFFPKGVRPGDPLSKRGVLDGILRLAHALDAMTVHNGRIDWQNGEPKIILGDVSGLTPGVAQGSPDQNGMRSVTPGNTTIENDQDPPRDGGGGALGLPEPPDSGNYMLVSRDGAIAWEEVEAFACPEGTTTTTT